MSSWSLATIMHFFIEHANKKDIIVGPFNKNRGIP